MRRLGTAVSNLLWSLCVVAILAAAVSVLFMVAFLWRVSGEFRQPPEAMAL